MSKKNNKNKSQSNSKWRYKTGQHLIKKEDAFKVLYRDKRAFKSMFICGHVKHEQLLSIVSKNRIETYEKEGLIQKVVSSNGKITAYKLSKKGRNFVDTRLGWQGAYVPKSLEHDLILANKFFKLSETQQESAKSETQVRNELKEKAFLLHDDKQKTETLLKYIEEQTSPVDFMYERIDPSTGEIESVGFEGVTASYSSEDRQMKHNFCHHYGCKLEMRRS